MNLLAAVYDISQWVEPSYLFLIGAPDDPKRDHWIPREIKEIGHVDSFLIELEKQTVKCLAEGDLFANPLQEALSKWWIFALYESLRTYRQRNGAYKDHFEELFRRVETVRMPLAKHEVAKIHDSTHYPNSCIDHTNGDLSWEVYTKTTGQLQRISRKEIRDEFLRICYSICEEKNHS